MKGIDLAPRVRCAFCRQLITEWYILTRLGPLGDCCADGRMHYCGECGRPRWHGDL